MSDVLDLNNFDLSNYAEHFEKRHNVRVKRNSKYLCFRCANATVMQLEGAGNPVVRCGAIGERVPDTVTECSAFQAEGTLSFWDMVKIAKVIDFGDKQVGFTPYSGEDI